MLGTLLRPLVGGELLPRCTCDLFIDGRGHRLQRGGGTPQSKLGYSWPSIQHCRICTNRFAPTGFNDSQGSSDHFQSSKQIKTTNPKQAKCFLSLFRVLAICTERIGFSRRGGAGQLPTSILSSRMGLCLASQLAEKAWHQHGHVRATQYNYPQSDRSTPTS